MFFLMLSDEDCGCSDSLISSLFSKVLLLSLIILSLVLPMKYRILVCLFSLAMGLLSILLNYLYYVYYLCYNYLDYAILHT